MADNPLNGTDPSGLKCGWSDPGGCVSAAAIVSLIPIPVVQEVAGAVAIGAGALAAYEDGTHHRYASMALDIVGVSASALALGSVIRAGALGDAAADEVLRNAIADWLGTEARRASSIGNRLGLFGAGLGTAAFGLSGLFGGRLSDALGVCDLTAALGAAC